MISDTCFLFSSLILLSRNGSTAALNLPCLMTSGLMPISSREFLKKVVVELIPSNETIPVGYTKTESATEAIYYAPWE